MGRRLSQSFVMHYLIFILFALLVLFFLERPKQLPPEKQTDDFVDNPALFHKRFIRLTAKVEIVLQDSFWQRISRKLLKRSRHQRMLISSTALKNRGFILVHHNIAFGEHKLHPGVWIEIQGEYIHRQRPKKSGFGKNKHLYGMIHFTHKPLGYFKTLPSKPNTIPKVHVLRASPETA